MANFIGTPGNDDLTGTSDRDYFIGGEGNDRFSGRGGDDRIFGEAGNDRLSGNSGNDLIVGDGGNDWITGGSGVDTVAGGPGDDTYFDEPQSIDTITENFDEGTDTVVVNPVSSYFLPANVENLTLEGESSSLLSYGNALDNVITGNDASNILFGSAGNDTILGNGAGDAIAGDSGDDILTGGDGNDRFFYNTNAPFTTDEDEGFGVDTITDFTPVVAGSVNFDQIVLDVTTFDQLRSDPGPGFEVTGDFTTVDSDEAAATSEAFIVYSTGTGNLFYNQNNNDPGFGEGALFANVLTGDAPANLTAVDFNIQA